MATVIATITGDISDFVDVDFTTARAVLRANTPFIVDRDDDKIRLASAVQPIASDGTFTFTNVVASVDTIADGTLQYYIDISYRHGSIVIADGEITLGPFLLAGGTQDLSDLETMQPTDMVRAIPDDVDIDVLAAAEAYTDSGITGHEAAPNPHPQYARLVNGSGAPTGGRIIFAGAGAQFPPVEVGSILIYGGQ